MKKDDVVLNIGPTRWGHLHTEGELVQAVASGNGYIQIRGQWFPSANFRVIGPLSFFEKRLAEQMEFLPILERRSYYSEARRTEVIDSAHFITSRISKLLTRLKNND